MATAFGRKWIDKKGIIPDVEIKAEIATDSSQLQEDIQLKKKRSRCCRQWKKTNALVRLEIKIELATKSYRRINTILLRS